MKKSWLLPFCRRTRDTARRFRRDRRGVSSIEMGFVALPFIAITLGTMEVALVHLMRSSVANAVDGAARPIYTGAAGCATVDTVKTEICNRIAMKNENNCKDNLKVILEELSSFDASRSNVGENFDAINSSVDPGGSDSVMLLRTYFRWNVMFPLLAEALGGEEGEILLGASTAFKNEPFGETGGCGA